MLFFVNLGIALSTLFMVFTVMSRLEKMERQLSTLLRRVPAPPEKAAAESKDGETGAPAVETPVES